MLLVWVLIKLLVMIILVVNFNFLVVVVVNVFMVVLGGRMLVGIFLSILVRFIDFSKLWLKCCL